MMTAGEETRLVKKALIKDGFTSVSVGHDRGTAAAWLDIAVDMLAGKSWDETHDAALAVVQRVTGRHGEHDGEIMISIRREE